VTAARKRSGKAKRGFTLAAVAVGVLLLAGCARSAHSEAPRHGLADTAGEISLPVPKPAAPSEAQLALAVPGVTESYVGLASWYGRRFHGRPTASGSLFDMAALTAAHPSLPFGSRVRVTNLANGRSVTVTITDRGPYVEPRVIDLSRAAAEQLGFLDDGLARVRLDVLASSSG